MTGRFQLGDWQVDPLVGTVSLGDQTVKLELVEVREGPRAPGLEQFALVFEAADGAEAGLLQEGLYTLVHPKARPSLVRLAPSDTDAARYVSYVGLFS